MSIVFLLSSVTAPRSDGVLFKGHKAGVLTRVELTTRIDRADQMEPFLGGELDAFVLRMHRAGERGRPVRRLHVELLDERRLARVVRYCPVGWGLPCARGV